jgi:serine/threonine-protein kinase
VKLTDFGIARATSRGSDTLPGFVKGTPQYLSPEQAAGRPVDARTDVYSLGLVLKQLLPADADPELVAIADAATEPAVRDRLPNAAVLVARLQAWRIAHGVVVDPERLASLVRETRRTANARAIALDHALRDEPSSARTRQIAAPQPPARSRWRWIALGVAAVAITTSIAIATLPARDSEAREPVATVRPTHTAPLDTPPSTPALAEPMTPAITTAVTPPPATPTPKRARKAIAEPGRLRVNVLPWAQVTIDGEDWGRTPIDRELDAGEHTVELYNPDSQQRVKKPVRIMAGKPSSIETW